ncbi:hypothetical protein UFOVP75_125 [uncultured Caudovirales phage]|uniref:DNA primase n=1 Tax=uncultured Caudovirales phage TaxID=2100421 RepID=A0A6J5L140_9CAUD|nr:hypothetical protein UFOVP75_125 [uncultured Caudovirales phage]
MALDLQNLKTLVETLTCKESRKSWIFDCPQCGKKDKLFIRKRDGRFICWYCATIKGYQGKPEFALRDLLGLSLREVQLRLYGDVSYTGSAVDLEIEIKDFLEDDEIEQYAPLQQVVFPLHYVELERPSAKKGVAYLESRGISLEVANQYGIRYSVPDRRIVFPVYMNEILVGWQDRMVEPVEYTDPITGEAKKAVKAITMPGLDRNRVLMFQHNLVGSDHAIIMEGPIDGIKARLCGGAVVTMGKSVSKTQMDIILESGVKKIYSGLDPDAAAEVSRLCREFSGFEFYQMKTPESVKDFGAMDELDVLECYKSADRVNAGCVFIPPILQPF